MRKIWQYLTKARTRRRKRHGRTPRKDPDPARQRIHHRPTEANDRSQFGHWEADSVLGASKVRVHTMIERASRKLYARLIPDGTAPATLAAQQYVCDIEAGNVRSITCDNGSEFAAWKTLQISHQVTTYFADPYSAWQRGTVEHFNGRLRRYLPKKTDLATISQHQLDHITDEINNTPLKCLNAHTPNETHHRLKSTPPPHCRTSD